jgi:N6-adenosine-specific RNA methylase IME4
VSASRARAHGLPLLRAWGFAYKTSACWDKLAGSYGVGSYWRMEHELLLLGVRPKSPTHFNENTLSSMIRVKRTRNHSEKPEHAHRMMERAIPGPYLELFARKHVHGWTCYGNQLRPFSAVDGEHDLLAADPADHQLPSLSYLPAAMD